MNSIAPIKSKTQLLRFFLRLQIYFFGAIVMVTMGCVNNELRHKAFKKSDHLISNLDKDSAYLFFSKKYFNQDEIKILIADMKSRCDFRNRKSRFINDFYQRDIGDGLDNVFFIYELELACDTVRFITKFSLSGEPELIGFKVEPIEQRNPLVEKN